VKTKQGAIIGGFTTKSWGPFTYSYTVDDAAFIFNMNQRFNQTTGKHSIYLRDDGFEFGNKMFEVSGSQLNQDNAGKNNHANTGWGYDIPKDSSGKSSLTGEAGSWFTPVELEVFKVVNY
jgi:uncharacterized protein YgfB (UPF0149 family)